VYNANLLLGSEVPNVVGGKETQVNYHGGDPQLKLETACVAKPGKRGEGPGLSKEKISLKGGILGGRGEGDGAHEHPGGGWTRSKISSVKKGAQKKRMGKSWAHTKRCGANFSIRIFDNGIKGRA